jgi:hypothetical protein
VSTVAEPVEQDEDDREHAGRLNQPQRAARRPPFTLLRRH